MQRHIEQTSYYHYHCSTMGCTLSCFGKDRSRQHEETQAEIRPNQRHVPHQLGSIHNDERHAPAVQQGRNITIQMYIYRNIICENIKYRIFIESSYIYIIYRNITIQTYNYTLRSLLLRLSINFYAPFLIFSKLYSQSIYTWFYQTIR